MAETMVKICGLTNLQDALWARDCGADMLGFVMVPTSPRYVTPLQAARITRALRRLGPGPRGQPRLVGVFADRNPYVVRLVAELCALDVIQLHGHEPAEQAALYDRPVILAQRVGSPVAPGFTPPVTQVSQLAALDVVSGDPSLAHAAWAAQDDRIGVGQVRKRGALQADAVIVRPWAILLDTYDPRRLGGSGQAWDWALLRDASRPDRLIVAGGLTPGNVAQAIRTAHPWGVDVSSGVEAAPGRKDPTLVQRFIQQVREEDRRNARAAPQPPGHKDGLATYATPDESGL